MGRQFITVSFKRLTSTGTITQSARGKHSPPNKTTTNDIDAIHNHIASYPAYESHYSRRHTSRKYLHPDLTVATMHRAYVTQCEERGTTPKGYSTYRRVFKSANLHFKSPSNDTCKTCDAFMIRLKQCKTDEERLAIKDEQKVHHTKADNAYLKKKHDKEAACNSGGSIVVVSFDLQKVLETPKLSTNIVYYLRLLSTYNLTTVNLGTREVMCDCWDETQGNRGSDEVATVMFKRIMSLPDTVVEHRLWSDCCSGQNHNYTMAIMFVIALEQKPSLQKIEHNFLEVGHTHLEADHVHARIERAKPKGETISIPKEWYGLIRGVPHPNSEPFQVFEYEYPDFLNFKSQFTGRQSLFVRRLLCIDNSNLDYHNAKYVCVDRANPTFITLSNSVNPSDPTTNPRQVNCMRNKKNQVVPHVELKQKYKARLNISDNKYNDLMVIVGKELIAPEYFDFYRQLPHSATARDIHADLPCDKD